MTYADGLPWYFDWIREEHRSQQRRTNEETEGLHPDRAADRRRDHRHPGGYCHSEPADRYAALQAEEDDGRHAYDRDRVGSARDRRQPLQRGWRDLSDGQCQHRLPHHVPLAYLREAVLSY